MKGAAIASLVAFAVGQGLTCKIRTLLLKQCLAVLGEARKDSVLRAVPGETIPVPSSGEIAPSPAARQSMRSSLLQWERRVKNVGAGKGKVKYVKPLSCT